jgi:hypothetical protein
VMNAMKPADATTTRTADRKNTCQDRDRGLKP